MKNILGVNNGNMKVFISWSGNKSHKVAMVFREWLPSVIQSLIPYVSSEDIDKGARWSTDIAKELEDSTFGILCVTKDNMHAPWLSFEAGALSKTVDKAFVSPFLFDIKRSEVDGPILQFQSTIFEKDDIKKLIQTLNKACGEDGISATMLDKAFDVWYPTLESELNKLKEITETEETDSSVISSEQHATAIIEEILELTRDNQKLLRNPDSKLSDSIETIKEKLEDALNRYERVNEISKRRHSVRMRLHFQEDFLHELLPNCQNEYAFLIVLSMIKDEYPWIYDMGKELIDEIKSDLSNEKRLNMISDFKHILDYTCEHPMVREMNIMQKEAYMFLRDIQYILNNILKKIEFEDINQTSKSTRRKRSDI